MISLRHSKSSLILEINFVGFLPLGKMILLAVHEFFYWRIHPSGRSPASILRRNWLQQPM